MIQIYKWFVRCLSRVPLVVVDGLVVIGRHLLVRRGSVLVVLRILHCLFAGHGACARVAAAAARALPMNRNE